MFVHVTGKGNAVHSQQSQVSILLLLIRVLIFTFYSCVYVLHFAQSTEFNYTIAINNVTPDRGSTAGGLVITIQGSGFSNDKSEVAVTLDESSCDVIESSLSRILCRAPAHAAGQVLMKVTVSGSSVERTNSFEYDAASTPTITSLSPENGQVSGGNVMTILGSGFGTSSDLTVNIGNRLCKVIDVRDNQVQCTLPPHHPAVVNITMSIPGKGYPILPPSYRFYEYVLRVDSISPLIGSIAGGTILTITGSGFSNNTAENKVAIGNKDCRVTSSNASSVTCVTQDNFKTIKVNNFGTHPGKTRDITSIIVILPTHFDVMNNTNCISFHLEYGKGYAWSIKLVEIDLGDSVEVRIGYPIYTIVMHGISSIDVSVTDFCSIV